MIVSSPPLDRCTYTPYSSYMNTNTAAQAANQTMTALVNSGMTVEQAAAYLVDRMIAERPELAAKVFAGLVAA